LKINQLTISQLFVLIKNGCAHTYHYGASSNLTLVLRIDPSKLPIYLVYKEQNGITVIETQFDQFRQTGG